MSFVRTTILGGMVVVAPLLVGVTAVVVAVKYAAEGAIAALNAIGIDSAGDALHVTVVGIVGFLALCFIAGLAVRTAAGSVTHRWMEEKVLSHLPGYELIRPLMSSFITHEEAYPVGLVDLYGTGARVPVIVIDDFDADHQVVFVPLAPTPTIGDVYVVARNDIALTGGSQRAVIGALGQWGHGLQEMREAKNEDQVPAKE